MPSLETLDHRDLTAINAATETVYNFREYLPGRVRLAMVWSFRNQIRAQMRAGGQPYPGLPEIQELRALEPHRLDALAEAVAVMLEARFTAVMEDPELPRRLTDLSVKIKAEMGERADEAETAGSGETAELEVPVS